MTTHTFKFSSQTSRQHLRPTMTMMLIIVVLGLPFMMWYDDFDISIYFLLIMYGMIAGSLIAAFGIVWLITNRSRKQFQQPTVTLTETAIEHYDGQQSKRFVYQDIDHLIIHYNHPDIVYEIQLVTPNDLMSFWGMEPMSDLLQILQTHLADTVKIEERYRWAPKWHYLTGVISVIITMTAYSLSEFFYNILLGTLVSSTGVYTLYQLKQPGIYGKQRTALILSSLLVILLGIFYVYPRSIHPCDAIARYIQKSGCMAQLSGDLYVGFLPDNETVLYSTSEQVKIQPISSSGWNTTRLYHDNHLRGISASTDGTVIATEIWGDGYSDIISVWDISSQTIIWQKDYPPSYENKMEGIESFTLSPNGQQLALGRQHEVVLWDIAADKPISTLPASYPMTFSSDSLQIATKGQEDHSVDIWQVKTGQKINTLGQWKDGYLSHLAYSLDGRFLLAQIRGSSEIFVWRLDMGEIEQTWSNEYLDDSSPPAISADGRWVALGYQTDQDVNHKTYIKIWQVADGTVLKTIWLTEYRNPPKHLSFSPDSRLLGIATFNEVLIYDMAVLLGEELYEK